MRRRHAPTIEQVAARAGVSRGTASRVINGESGIAPWRVEAVNRAIADLGYVPNVAARALVTQRADSVALLIGTPGELLGSEYFLRLVRGLHRELRGADLALVLLSWEDEAEQRRVARFATSGQLAGAAMIGVPLGDPLPDRLRGDGVVTVIAGRTGADPGPWSVDVDNIGGTRRAVRHLLDLGRRRIATIAGVRAISAGTDRFEAWRSTLADAGIEHGDDLVEGADFTRDGGERAMAALLARRPDLDAVFVASDAMALGALEALHAAGRRVPADVAVVGFDGNLEGQRSKPPLTSVLQPVEDLGSALGRTLVSALGGAPVAPPPPLPTTLVVRESCGGLGATRLGGAGLP